MEGYGQSSSESGTVTVEGPTVIFMRSLPTPDVSRAQWQRDGTSVTLEGDSEFDFNSDLTPEEAMLRTAFVPPLALGWDLSVDLFHVKHCEASSRQPSVWRAATEEPQASGSEGRTAKHRGSSRPVRGSPAGSD